MADRTVAMLIELLADPRRDAVNRQATAEEMRARVPAASPELGRPYEELLEDLREDVIPYRSRTGAPSYFAFIPGGATFPGALGDFIASALNIISDSWMESAGTSRLELTVLDWFKDWLGYPAESAGVLLSGGSAANMTALACARESLIGSMRDDVLIYASDQGHSSIARAARTLGFRPEQLRVLPVDSEYRMRTDALAGAIEMDKEDGRRPLIVCAAAGSTNTGAVDPLPEIAEVCRDHGAWLHVDGAYGGFAALTERGSRALAGIEAADSITLDPHKWLFQPYECGCLLVRQGRLLEEAFTIVPDYLRDIGVEGQEVNFSDRGLQLTRMARALKIWVSVSTFGVAAFRDAMDRALDLAVTAQERVEASEELELLDPARLGIVCFRRRFGDERSDAERDVLNARLVAGLADSGVGMVSSTRLRGRYAIRMCVLNHSSAAGDVEAVLRWLEQADVEQEPTVPTPGAAGMRSGMTRDRSLGQMPAREGPVGDGVPARAVSSLSLFRDFTPEQLELVLRFGRTRDAPPGEEVTRRWGRGREFYVILEGSVRVEVGGKTVRELTTGDFFGELAALDWGAGYGYARLASVIANAQARLLIIPTDVFNRLVRDAPGFRLAIEEAVRERLPTS